MSRADLAHGGRGIGGIGLVRWLTKALRGKLHHDYTIAELEQEIYDNRLKLTEGLYSVDKDEEPPPGLVRCFTDRWALAIDLVMLFFVSACLVSAPITFIWSGGWRHVELVPGGYGLLIFDAIGDVVYAICLLVRLNMSYIHPTRRVEVVNRRRIRDHYLYSPTYFLMWLSVLAHPLVLAFDAPLLMVLKAVRMVHVVRLPDSLWWLADRSWWRLSRPMWLLLCGSHWVACLFACVGNYRQHRPNYHTSLGNETVDGLESLYVMALIESIYMLTGALDNPVGEGSIREDSLGALLIIALFGPIGCIVAAYFIEAIARESRLAKALEIRHEENRAFILRACQNLNISVGLQRRVFSSHVYQQISHDYEAFRELFDPKNISAPLDLALRVYLYNETVLFSDFFKGKNHSYILEVVKVLDDRTFVPGDYVVRKGEVGVQMYFVADGELGILVPSPGTNHVKDAMRVGILTRGAFFGEVALIEDSPRTAWIMAETYALLSELHRRDLERIWHYFPDERAALQRRVTETAKRDRERALKHRGIVLEEGTSESPVDETPARSASDADAGAGVAAVAAAIPAKATRTASVTVAGQPADALAAVPARRLGNAIGNPHDSPRAVVAVGPGNSNGGAIVAIGCSGFSSDGGGDGKSSVNDSAARRESTGQHTSGGPLRGLVSRGAANFDSMTHLSDLCERLVLGHALLNSKAQELLKRQGVLERKVEDLLGRRSVARGGRRRIGGEVPCGGAPRKKKPQGGTPVGSPTLAASSAAAAVAPTVGPPPPLQARRRVKHSAGRRGASSASPADRVGDRAFTDEAEEMAETTTAAGQKKPLTDEIDSGKDKAGNLSGGGDNFTEGARRFKSSSASEFASGVAVDSGGDGGSSVAHGDNTGGSGASAGINVAATTPSAQGEDVVRRQSPPNDAGDGGDSDGKSSVASAVAMVGIDND